jgi:excisionase family DNA binding protein
MRTTREKMGVLTPSKEEVDAARELEEKLRSSPDSHVGLVFEVAGEEHVVLKRAATFFKALIHEVAQGRRVGLVHLDEELSTTGAAEILGVSRPTLVGLLKQDLIPHRMVGTHRRVPHAALLEYRKKLHPAAGLTVEDRLRATDQLLARWHAAEEPTTP